MASPSLGPSVAGGQPPPSTALPGPMSGIVNGLSGTSRPSSEPKSATSGAEPRTSQPPMHSPALSQGPIPRDNGTPVNGTQHQKPAGEVKAVVGTDGYTELAGMIKSSKPEIVRQVVRDLWQRCLTGSDFHIGFILNTALHHASTQVLDQAVQDFGGKFASRTKHKWVEHLNTEDVDELADALFQKGSDRFLDRALARRFETISGRALVNALARAERLGYDTRDIVEEKDSNKSEQVIPSMHPSRPAGYAPSGPILSQQPSQTFTPQYPQQARQQQQPAQMAYRPPPPPPSYPVTHPTPAEEVDAAEQGIVFCDTCGRPCSGPVAVENHLRKKACTNHVIKLERLGSDTCIHCGVFFSSNGGLLYHNKSNVCGLYGESVQQKMMALLTERAKVPAVKPVPITSSQPSQASTYHAAGGQQYPPTASLRSSPARVDFADAYNALTPDQQSRFDADMKAAEDMYGGQMRDAMALPPAQAELELAKIKNRLNSRQSNLRKRYGIKLRDRRTKAQIDADNARIAANSPQPPPSQGVKRPFPTQDDSPRKRVPLHAMSGLNGAAASAQMTDPTLGPAPAQSRAPSGQQPQPAVQAPGAPAAGATPTAAPQPSAAVPEAHMHGGGSLTDPVTIDDEQSTAATNSGRPSPSATEKDTADESRPPSAGAAA